MTSDVVTELHEAFVRDTDPWDVTLYTRAADEIERLRAAGDQLASFIHIHMSHAGWTTADRGTAAFALDAWEEARRG